MIVSDEASSIKHRIEEYTCHKTENEERTETFYSLVEADGFGYDNNNMKDEELSNE